MVGSLKILPFPVETFAPLPAPETKQIHSILKRSKKVEVKIEPVPALALTPAVLEPSGPEEETLPITSDDFQEPSEQVQEASEKVSEEDEEASYKPLRSLPSTDDLCSQELHLLTIATLVVSVVLITILVSR